jgi:lipopolysaccharide transport system ATP-binding protein
MSQISIEVENLSKLYRLGDVGRGTIKDDLNRFWHRVRGKEDPFLQVGQTNDRTNKEKVDFVWALKDINFEVDQGEVVGIVGRNGAGKSTLLKIITKITSPTTGKINIKGRIASLLEVGTGFHPDLTGRENVFMNGAILGMRKWEIQKKFDEIVDFAGVAAYIDTPVKRYSSGMIVRLGFAVAAHLEPEILIVDEVLAVGDVEFQKKCLGRMKDISKNDGRTVLFVSHNMAAVKSLCNKALLLNNGGIEFFGNSTETIGKYLGVSNDFSNNQQIFNNIELNQIFKLNKISIKGSNSKSEEMLLETDMIELKTEFELQDESPEKYHITYHLNNELGDTLFSFSSANSIIFKKNENRLICFFPENFFQAGSYFLSFYLVYNKQKAILIEKDLFSFTIVNGKRDMGVYMGKEPGFIRPKFKWIELNENQ